MESSSSPEPYPLFEVNEKLFENVKQEPGTSDQEDEGEELLVPLEADADLYDASEHSHYSRRSRTLSRKAAENAGLIPYPPAKKKKRRYRKSGLYKKPITTDESELARIHAREMRDKIYGAAFKIFIANPETLDQLNPLMERIDGIIFDGADPDEVPELEDILEQLDEEQRDQVDKFLDEIPEEGYGRATITRPSRDRKMSRARTERLRVQQEQYQSQMDDMKEKFVAKTAVAVELYRESITTKLELCDRVIKQLRAERVRALSEWRAIRYTIQSRQLMACERVFRGVDIALNEACRMRSILSIRNLEIRDLSEDLEEVGYLTFKALGDDIDISWAHFQKIAGFRVELAEMGDIDLKPTLKTLLPAGDSVAERPPTTLLSSLQPINLSQLASPISSTSQPRMRVVIRKPAGVGGSSQPATFIVKKLAPRPVVIRNGILSRTPITPRPGYVTRPVTAHVQRPPLRLVPRMITRYPRAIPMVPIKRPQSHSITRASLPTASRQEQVSQSVLDKWKAATAEPVHFT